MRDCIIAIGAWFVDSSLLCMPYESGSLRLFGFLGMWFAKREGPLPTDVLLLLGKWTRVTSELHCLLEC